MNRATTAPRRPGWARSVLVSGVATATAMGLMFWARAVFQIRTLPERIMEWLLLFIPLDQFEKGVQTFGPQAKELALVGAIIVMALILFGLGLKAVRGAWSGWAVLILAPLLWLFAMGVVMPLTGAGWFASMLFQNVWLVNASYLGLAAAYVAVLLLGLAVVPQTVLAGSSTTVPSRRPLLLGLAGLAGSYAAVVWFARQGISVGSSLPLASARPAAPAAPPAAGTTLPPAVQTAVAEAASPISAPTGLAPVPSPASGPGAEVNSASVALPVPAPPRELSRDKDGSLTAAGRKPGELSPLITANRDFYVVTKNAGGDPQIKPDGWRCIIDGEVNQPVQVDYRTLRQLPSVELIKTLECISNFTAMCELTSFGCDLVSTARWKGVRLRDLFDLAGGIKGSAVALAVLSTDEFTSSIPLEVALDPDTILAYEMNGEVLPYEHGYPARVLAPGRYGFKSAKWVAALRPMSQQFADWYGQRNWNREGLVKTMTRIDLPVNSAELDSGSQRVAGIAYAGDRGLKLVELSVDGGQSWQPTSLVEPQVGKDAWVRWQSSFETQAGAAYKLIVRTTDGTGQVQTETFGLPQPDGGSGRHSIEVKTRR